MIQIEVRKPTGEPSSPHFVRVSSKSEKSLRIYKTNKQGVVKISSPLFGPHSIFIDGVHQGKFLMPGIHTIKLPIDHHKSQQIFHEGK